MICRASRIAHRLASVAVSVKLQCCTPKRRDSSAATQAASWVGSMVVAPPASPYRRVRAAWTATGEWPAIAPVSPRQKSMNSLPSMSISRAPDAAAMYTGNPPAHIRIQVIGTPPSRWPPEELNASQDPGKFARYSVCSRLISSVSRLRSMVTGPAAASSDIGHTSC